MRPNFKRLEWVGLDHNDRALLKAWQMTEERPGARKMVLVGRLQRELRLTGAILTIDGLYGAHTDHALRIAEEQCEHLGPELRQIVDEERRKTKPAV